MSDIFDQLWSLADQVGEAIDSLDQDVLDPEALAEATVSLDNAYNEILEAISILKDAS